MFIGWLVLSTLLTLAGNAAASTLDAPPPRPLLRARCSRLDRRPAVTDTVTDAELRQRLLLGLALRGRRLAHADAPKI